MMEKICQGGGMKRLLPLIPIILIFLINSCITYPTSNIGATSTTIPTEDSVITAMIKSLNYDLATISPLGSVMDAQYYVIDVLFLDIPNTSERNIQVNVKCTCMNDTDCCLPERTFVMIVESMRRNNSHNTLQSYGIFREFTVVCSNQQTGQPIKPMTVAWKDVKGYLTDPGRAYELGGHVNHTPVP
jgi:hypothetical protein